ncbi:Glycine betaine methyltransferase (plasmid) [Pseudoseohaeicola sp. NH-UV-7]|uniref:trimethylamine methyltransferase family protein n=1 Tax=unclassified Sulfitobacter TaxID=196795 RepID=UPI000E0C82E0|nr:trimethylamine methyltransferase family protein [Sulfitobacter sp. JL08]AXI53355.1 methyltransferase [Sulfitobacter sp. JL08]
MSRTNRKPRRPQSTRFEQPPFAEVRSPLRPVDFVSEDQIETIHHASLKVLADIGLRVNSAVALDLYAAAGADVDHDRELVRFDPALVEEMLTDIPSEFTIHARDPAKTLKVGGNRLTFATVSGPSFVSDIDRGRRAGTVEDMRDFVKISAALNIFHHDGGSGCEPLELPPESRHLDMMLAQTTLSDKGWHPCWLNSAARARDCIEMAKIALQTDDDGLRARPGIIGGINTNSPLFLDDSQAEGLIEFARAGQPIHVTPFTLAGAMSPVTIGGSLVQQNAEALAGIVLGQAAARGSPIFYGHFTSNVDMRTGSPAFGTPEYAKSVIVSGQLARRYGLPLRSSNTTASACVDLQAAYESDMSVSACVQAHVNVMLHGGGWLEGGLTCSFEKLILDAEILQMQAAYLQPLDLGEDALGLEAMAEAGPGGHFFGTAHTLARYETAFYKPILSDWRNFETWEEDGAKTATQRANTIWKQLLREYEKPPIDPAVEEELEAYVAKRKEQIET